MGRRRWTQKVVIGETVVKVSGWKAGETLRDGGLRPLWSAPSGAWLVDLKHAADVIALVECSGAAVVIEGRVPNSPIGEFEPAPDTQLSLFGGGL